ncbi:nuclear transport factor 2 family protein [bacterium]|nr:nuclear transport factor 2 family protein [bacterium]
MSNTMRAFLVMACVPFVLMAQHDAKKMSSEQQQTIEQAIIDTQAKMQQAAQRGDVDALYAYVLEMDKGVIIEDGRIRWTRQDALNATKQGLQGLKDLVYSYTKKNVTAISPDAALWVGEGTSSATLQDGRKISVPFAESILFVQKEGQWKVFHAHRSVPNQ